MASGIRNLAELEILLPYAVQPALRLLVMRHPEVFFALAKCCLAATLLLLTSCGSSTPAVTLLMTPPSTYLTQSYSSQFLPFQEFRVTRSDGAPISSLTVSTTGGYCIVGGVDVKPGATEQDVIGRCSIQCPPNETHGTITASSENLSATASITCNINP